MSIEAFAQILAAGAIVAGAAYWGGQIKTAVSKLCAITQDHEERIRELEAS